MKKLSVAVLTLVILPGVTEAVNNIKTKSKLEGFKLGAGVSATSGFNAFVGYHNKKAESFIGKRLGVRMDFGTTSLIKSMVDKTFNNYLGDNGKSIGDKITVKDADVKSEHFGVVADFYPFGDTWLFGGIRISGGYYNGKFDSTTKLANNSTLIKDGSFSLGDNVYNYFNNKNNAEALVNWKYSGPYLGAGFDLGLFSNLKIYFDAGVVFAGNSAKIDINIPDYAGLQYYDYVNSSWERVVNGAYTATNVNTLNTAKAEAVKDAQKKLNKYDYYPMVKLGLMYNF